LAGKLTQLVMSLATGLVGLVFGAGIAHWYSVDAAHPQGHAIGSQRDALTGEEYCLGFQSPYFQSQYASFRSSVQQAFVNSFSGDDWDYESDNKIAFAAYYTDCNYLGPSVLAETEIRYWIAPDWTSPCGSSGISCVFKWGSYYYVNGTAYWSGANVYMDGDLATGYHHINHETGHVLGLDDPPPCDPGGGANASVMHDSYYCGGYTNYAYPTTADRIQADIISDN